MIHIYCGDGKGKTTASVGLAVRSAGTGMKVYFVRLMKGNYSSELAILEAVPEITVRSCDRNYGFSNQMSESDKADITACHNRMLSDAFASGADLIVLDEFFSAYNLSLVDTALADSLIMNMDSVPELVLTGRDPLQKFIQIADYVSEIKSVKHPYTKGIKARKGIEY